MQPRVCCCILFLFIFLSAQIIKASFEPVDAATFLLKNKNDIYAMNIGDLWFINTPLKNSHADLKDRPDGIELIEALGNNTKKQQKKNAQWSTTQNFPTVQIICEQKALLRCFSKSDECPLIKSSNKQKKKKIAYISLSETEIISEPKKWYALLLTFEHQCKNSNVGESALTDYFNKMLLLFSKMQDPIEMLKMFLNPKLVINCGYAHTYDAEYGRMKGQRTAFDYDTFIHFYNEHIWLKRLHRMARVVNYVSFTMIIPVFIAWFYAKILGCEAAQECNENRFITASILPAFLCLLMGFEFFLEPLKYDFSDYYIHEEQPNTWFCNDTSVSWFPSNEGHVFNSYPFENSTFFLSMYGMFFGFPAVVYTITNQLAKLT